MPDTHLQPHFADLAKQTHAARLGMWAFLASEILFFGALFTLFATYSAEYGKVFREAGYKAEQRYEEGVLMLTLDLEPTETSREVMAAREHRAESRSIGRLLSPRSVAVIGASREEHSVGQTVLRNLKG